MRRRPPPAPVARPVPTSRRALECSSRTRLALRSTGGSIGLPPAGRSAMASAPRTVRAQIQTQVVVGAVAAARLRGFELFTWGAETWTPQIEQVSTLTQPSP